MTEALRCGDMTTAHSLMGLVRETHASALIGVEQLKRM